MRQEMHRNCTDAAVSSVQTGMTVKHETAGQGPFRLILAQGCRCAVMPRLLNVRQGCPAR